jgi:hypothetical protein
MYHFNTEKFYIFPTQYIYILYDSQDKLQSFP